MPDRKWIDARDFKAEGFLQESNRQFFHPHGLALAITRVTDGTIHVPALTAAQHERLVALAAGDEELSTVLTDAWRYEVGDAYYQGVWDLRDDPEGVVFGSWEAEDLAKVQRVAAERERHREAREAMFAAGSDVEHFDFVWTDPDA